MNEKDYVVLVDENDNFLGFEEKLAAHQQGKLHRAFSAFVFRERPLGPQLLLQQRQLDKYHSPGLWTNTCCSHPRHNEAIEAAGERRLFEELGFFCPLAWVGQFHYTAAFDNGLIENEFDHVLMGMCDIEKIPFNPQEVAQCRWVNLPDLEKELEKNSEHFTPWFKEAYAIAKAKILAQDLV